MKKTDVRMEDINKWVGLLVDEIENKVEDCNCKYRCDITGRECLPLDELFDDVRYVLERFFNHPDYRRFN